MKKIYFYLLALIAIGFASCDPNSKLYKSMDANPATQTLSITLGASDYLILPTTNYANKAAMFKTNADANLYVPTILNGLYGSAPEKSTAAVTFSLLPSTASISTDSLLTHEAYTLVAADYSVGGNTTAYLTDANAIVFLNAKYPTPVNNQLSVLTYNYFLSGVTASAGTTTTDSFLYLGGVWTKIYTVSPAQYASVGRGVVNSFITADRPLLASYLNTFLKADASVMAAATVGTIKYISYTYNSTYQNVIALTYNGTNWANASTLNYLKQNGTWIPDPTVYVTEPALKNLPDYVYLQGLNIGSVGARGNLVSFGDFNLSATSTTGWVDADITTAFAAILLHKFPSPAVTVPAVNYKVSYYVYSGATTLATKTYNWNGTAFVLAPVQ